jgi:hypothetical protein
MRQFITRFQWFAFETLLLFIAAIALVVWIESKRPDKDNATLYVIIFGFVTTNVGVLLSFATGQRNKDHLERQDLVLEQVHEKVNGGTARFMQALQEEHREALQKMMEDRRVERHDLANKADAFMRKAELLEHEMKSLLAEKVKAEARNAELVRELSRHAEPKVT